MGSQPTKLWSGYDGIGGDTVEDVVEGVLEDVIYYVVDEEMKRLRREELTYELAHAQEELKCAEKASELAESEFWDLHCHYNHESANQEEKDAYDAAAIKSRDTGSEIVASEIHIAEIKIESETLSIIFE